jgi:hypothetical protein
LLAPYPLFLITESPRFILMIDRNDGTKSQYYFIRPASPTDQPFVLFVLIEILYLQTYYHSMEGVIGEKREKKGVFPVF